MVTRFEPDLAILDIKMPYTDGLQAAKTLARTHPLPILLLTAYSEQDLIEKATDLPIQGYLIKPIKPAELSAAITVAYKRFVEQQMLADRADKLQETLEMRKLVDRAKGKLMETGLSEEEAYQAMQREARNKGRTIKDVALAILAA